MLLNKKTKILSNSRFEVISWGGYFEQLCSYQPCRPSLSLVCNVSFVSSLWLDRHHVWPSLAREKSQRCDSFCRAERLSEVWLWTRIGHPGLGRCFRLVSGLVGSVCVHVHIFMCATTCTLCPSVYACVCAHLHLIAGDLIYPDTEIMFAFSFFQPCWSVTKLALTAPVHQAGLLHPLRPASYAASLRPRC